MSVAGGEPGRPSSTTFSICRPGIEGASFRAKIPLAEPDWQRLESLAAALTAGLWWLGRRFMVPFAAGTLLIMLGRLGVGAHHTLDVAGSVVGYENGELIVDVSPAIQVGDGLGFESPDNAVTIVSRAGEREVGTAPKQQIAAAVLDEVERLLTEQRRG